MRGFVLFAVLAVAAARPEPPSGYNYGAPPAVSSQGSGYSHGGAVSSQGNTGYSHGSAGAVSSGFGNTGSGGFGNTGAGGFGNSGFGSSSGFGGNSGFGGGQQQQQQQTIVQKHMWVNFKVDWIKKIQILFMYFF